VAANITNIFVLLLENRSFDHMLGFSDISGRNAEDGKPTAIYGLNDETNSYRGLTYKVLPAADDTMPVDPGHEFLDTLEQLCGTNVAYPPGGPYPPINVWVNASFDRTKIALESKMGRSLNQCESGDNMRMCALELAQKKTVTLMAEDNPKSTTTLIGCYYFYEK